jgi:uncharacterized protein YjgD (DUF1641 family)
MEISFSKVEKPDDWPQNQREASIGNVSTAFYRYNDSPTFENKEVLLALTTINEINESDGRGVVRITEYEIVQVNTLYLSALLMNINSLKIYLYRHIMYMVLTMRLAPNMVPGTMDNLFEPLEGLHPSLRLFFELYYDLRSAKIRSFVDTIIHIVNVITGSIDQQEDLRKLENYCVTMLYDLSFIPSKQVFSEITFDRSELKKLFEFLASIFKKTGSEISEPPLRGILCILMSNWILKSRNNYNDNYLYKYMSRDTVENVMSNQEIWMQKTALLNDQREGKLIHELYANKQWIKFDWAKNIDLKKPIILFRNRNRNNSV